MIVRYMAQEMSRNAAWALGYYGYWDRSRTFGAYLGNSAILAGFASHVRQNGPWDHKPILKRLVAAPQPFMFWTPLNGAPSWALRYDVWSNIHYGYVGRAMGIPRDILMDVQHDDGEDDPAVALGMDLMDHNDVAQITADELRRAVVARMNVFRRTPSSPPLVQPSTKWPY